MSLTEDLILELIVLFLDLLLVVVVEAVKSFCNLVFVNMLIEILVQVEAFWPELSIKVTLDYVLNEIGFEYFVIEDLNRVTI